MLEIFGTVDFELTLFMSTPSSRYIDMCAEGYRQTAVEDTLYPIQEGTARKHGGV